MRAKIALVVVALALISVSSLSAQEATSATKTQENIANIKEPLGGQPSAGAKPSVADLDYQVAYHRAFEAVRHGSTRHGSLESSNWSNEGENNAKD